MWEGGREAHLNAMYEERQRRLAQVPAVSDTFSARDRAARIREIRRWYWLQVWNSQFCLYGRTG